STGQKKRAFRWQPLLRWASPAVMHMPCYRLLPSAREPHLKMRTQVICCPFRHAHLKHLLPLPMTTHNAWTPYHQRFPRMISAQVQVGVVATMNIGSLSRGPPRKNSLNNYSSFYQHPHSRNPCKQLHISSQ